ncbi:YqaJ viral recombinase family protein [Mycobacteroides abscessus]|uniref:Putative phage-type endonuclease n=1 Tax=Mycobacteroides abscessus subsp. massiliense TaxID=1962118 RepID=A0A1U2CH51_9MYCO|nr:YqaJ viral recombinase family protein [Mycobacteroides abscessus]SKM28697.1 putative phage-type endonuclease [Mycobacteroides abscessus subsp. massiliense]SKT31931.1 putative phage-type endonuclease [Mycobacteroides abscessus subsp. massiliense]SKT69093.1 putative phage-type endonuclease [Mycobacteroides abscessus subsp. massiliense]SKX08796.1 putative phage-type endonuclease [Mycobacteroides abscessus subsp. massiliense]
MSGHTTGILGIYTKRDPEFLHPGSAQWSKMITPSKVAAILGVSRYESAYRLWHRMTDRCEPEPPKDAFDIGHDLEAYAANRWRRKNPGWLLSQGEVQVHVDPDKFGFPCVATIDRRGVRGRARRVVEFKAARNLTDLEMFGDDLTGDCPEDHAAQVQAQMLFTGWTELPGHLLAVGPYFDERIYEIPYSLTQATWILDEVRKFWELLKADEPPELDDSIHTYQCLRARHPDIEQGAAIVLDASDALEYVTARTDFEDAEKALQAAKNRLTLQMGNAQHAEFASTRIATRRAHGKGGVALYAAKSVTPEQIRFLDGETQS